MESLAEPPTQSAGEPAPVSRLNIFCAGFVQGTVSGISRLEAKFFNRKVYMLKGCSGLSPAAETVWLFGAGVICCRTNSEEFLCDLRPGTPIPNEDR